MAEAHEVDAELLDRGARSPPRAARRRVSSTRRFTTTTGVVRWMSSRSSAIRHPRRDEHERVALAARLRRDLGLDADRLGAVGDEHAVAVARGRDREPLEHALEHRVLEVGHQQGDRLAAAAHEASGGFAGRVVERRDGAVDLRDDRGVDGGDAVEDARDRRLRHAGVLRDLRHRDGTRRDLGQRDLLVLRY